MTLKIILAAAALGALAACSGGSEPAGDATTAAEPVVIPADSPAAKLTPGYLQGPWCYLRYEAGGEENLENITYDFAQDGTLTYQTTAGTPVDKVGSYQIEGGLLVIKPALAMFKFSPLSVDPDAMVLETMGMQAIWTRGACAP